MMIAQEWDELDDNDAALRESTGVGLAIVVGPKRPSLPQPKENNRPSAAEI